MTAKSLYQERFGDAFLLAIASAAGCATAKPVPDDDGIDWTLSCKHLQSKPRLDVQMKTTSLDDATGTVEIPRANILTPQALKALMQRIDDGEAL